MEYTYESNWPALGSPGRVGTQQEPWSPGMEGGYTARTRVPREGGYTASTRVPREGGYTAIQGSPGGLNHSILRKSSALFHIFTLQTFFTCDSDATSDDQSDESKCLLMNLGEQRDKFVVSFSFSFVINYAFNDTL